MGYKPIDEKLMEAEVAINNALNNQTILDRMAEYLYTVERIQEGAELLLSAQTLHQSQQAEYGDQFTASDLFQKAWEVAETVYIEHVKLARVALKKQRGEWQRLALNGARKESFSGWHEQAMTFYNNALKTPSVMTALAKVGITQAKLEAGRNLVMAAQEANETHEDEKGQAQNATVARDEAIDTLDDWMEDFETIAGIALADQPQLLESLGFGPVPA